MTSILKAGMVGLDTSHCQAFIEVLHDTASPYHVPGVRVTGVYTGGSAQFSLSRSRVKNFTAEIVSRFQIPTYESIPDLVKDVDVLFLTSVDGRQHLEQFNQMASGKPVFIDKPFAVTTADAASIIQRAAATNTPILSCSALRFAEGIVELVQSRNEILACEAYGPAPILPDYPGYFWYGIHGAEILFLLMGEGCQSVRTLTTDKMDVISGTWQDGRSGFVLGTHFEGYEFGCLVHYPSGARLSIARDTPPFHACLLKEIVSFFQSGQPPVEARETYQIIAFLEAANQSRAENGVPVPVSPLPVGIR
jgi:predicted dehydrogenase